MHPEPSGSIDNDIGEETSMTNAKTDSDESKSMERFQDLLINISLIKYKIEAFRDKKTCHCLTVSFSNI